MANRQTFLRFTLGLALLAPSACAEGPSGGGSQVSVRRGGGAANYGQQRIGYKSGAAAREDQAASAAQMETRASSEPLGDSDGVVSGGASFGGSTTGGTSGELVGGTGGGSAPPTYSADAGSAYVESDAGLCEADAALVDGAVDPCADAGAADAGTDEGTIKQSPDAAAQAQPAAEDEPVLENPYFEARQEPASTFALDVDGASYSLARAGLTAGHWPDPQSVRLEEFLNYFHLHYAEPEGEQPLSVYSEMGPCPWNPDHQLMLLGVQGQEVDVAEAPPANLVFLLDVSGSMQRDNKLPLVKKGIRLLTQLLRPQDRVSIVTYAGAERVVLEGVPGDQRETILAAVDALEAGGSTNGSGGIRRAYEIAHANFLEGGNNRVLLATDGDFNVGITGTEALKDFIADKRDRGVFLSLFGFGDAYGGGNYRDETGEQLTNHGDGIYFYIDGEEEARRAFLHSASGSLITVAKDVKIQVEFNPAHVGAHRLLGYENRVLANEDFSNDAVDGGELGASLSMTALYEIIPAGADEAVPAPLAGSVPERTAQGGDATADGGAQGGEEPLGPVEGDDLYEVRIRYKGPDGGPSELLRYAFDGSVAVEDVSLKFAFAASVAELASQLRGSQYIPDRGFDVLQGQLKPVLAIDEEGAVQEVLDLVGRVRELR